MLIYPYSSDLSGPTNPICFCTRNRRFNYGPSFIQYLASSSCQARSEVFSTAVPCTPERRLCQSVVAVLSSHTSFRVHILLYTRPLVCTALLKRGLREASALVQDRELTAPSSPSSHPSRASSRVSPWPPLVQPPYQGRNPTSGTN